MSFHSQGINPVVDGLNLSATVIEDYEDRLDALEAAGTGTVVSPATYTVRINGAFYEAWSDGSLTFGGSGDMGTVDGTDAQAVIQACIDALGTNGGKIFIRSGNYPLLRPIELDDYVEIEGETYGYVGAGGTILTLGVADNLIEAHGVLGTHMIAPVLKNLFLNGNGRSFLGNAIDFEYVSNSFIDGVYIINFDGSALKLSQAWNGVYRYLKVDDCGDLGTTRPTIDVSNGSADLWFEHCCVSIPHYTNFSISADSAAIVINGYIAEGDPASNTYALLSVAGTRVHLANCDLRGVDAGNTLVSVTGDDVGFNNCFFSAKGTCINVGAGADRCRFTGCDFQRYDVTNSEYGLIITEGNHIVDSCQFLYVNYGVFVQANAKVGINNNGFDFGVTAVYLNTSDFCQVTNNRVLYPSGHGIYLTGAENNVVTGNLVACSGFGGGAATKENIMAEGQSRYNIIVGNRVYDWGATVNYGIYEGGTSDANVITSNYASGNTGGIYQTGTATIIRDNKGEITENSGTGTILSGATSATVTHGCNYTPAAADITVTLAENPTNTPGAIWVDTITDTQFNVNCENDPGASNLDFAWSVRKVW